MTATAAPSMVKICKLTWGAVVIAVDVIVVVGVAPVDAGGAVVGAWAIFWAVGWVEIRTCFPFSVANLAAPEDSWNKK